MYSLYYFDSFFCQNIQWLFTRFRNQKNSLDGEVLFSIHYFSLACNEVGEERRNRHFILSLTLCVFLDMLSTLNRVTISVLIRRPAKSMAALVSLSGHVANLVFLVCFNTNSVLNHRMEFMMWWIFSLALEKDSSTAVGWILPVLWYFLWIKVKNIICLVLVFVHTFSSHVLCGLWQLWVFLLGVWKVLAGCGCNCELILLTQYLKFSH